MTAAASEYVEVRSWADLERLDADMDELAGQLSAIAGYARRWVCQRDGFEPGPLCLWRPLAEVMDVLADAFTALERAGREDWAGLRAGVGRTAHELRGLDDRVAADLRRVA